MLKTINIPGCTVASLSIIMHNISFSGVIYIKYPGNTVNIDKNNKIIVFTCNEYRAEIIS